MKKITLLLVIIFTFLFSTTSWGEWRFVIENGGNKWYYDKDRVRKSGKFLYVWWLMDYLKPSPSGVLSDNTYIELDCSIFRFKRLKIQTYNKSMGEGKMRLDFDPKDEWNYPKPKTVIEFVLNKVCEEHQKNYVSLDVKKREVFYYGNRDGKFGFYTEKWEGLETEENIDYVKYEGDTVNGVPNGQGTFTYTNGRKYVGMFKDGKKYGKGKETFPDESVYVGEFKNGEINGQGTLTFPDGTKYVGEWKDQKMNGQGTYTYDNGDLFEGEFKEGEQLNGTSYNKNGNILYKKVNGKVE
jgi:hypothetical protein